MVAFPFHSCVDASHLVSRYVNIDASRFVRISEEKEEIEESVGGVNLLGSAPMEPASVLLQKLQEWRKSDLIDEDGYQKKRGEVIASMESGSG